MATQQSAVSTIALPFDMVCKSAGFSADIGGSVAKIVYRDISDWDFKHNAPKKIDGDLALVRTKMFLRHQIDDVISFIRQHCKLTVKRGDENVLVYTTGVGCYFFIKELEQKLNIRIKNLTETDCFVKAFRFLNKHLPETQFLHEHSQKAVHEAELQKEKIQHLITTLKDKNLTEGNIDQFLQEKNSGETVGDGSSVYPCLLGMMGSAFGYMKLEADGTFASVDISQRGGRLLLGLGSLLTGAQSYEELVTLAEGGDSTNVHTMMGDLKKEEKDEHEDMYGHMPDSLMAFCFGKAVNKSLADFRREDIAMALIETLCLDITHIIDRIMEAVGTKVVYLSGGYANMPLIKEKLTAAYLSKTTMRGLSAENIRFVKNGSHLGALGAFMEGYA